jgi:trimeric autotransporter adhesin
MPTALLSTSSLATLRPRRARYSTLLLVTALFGLGACDDDEVTVPETARTVEVTPRISSVVAGQTRQLAAQAKNASGENISNDNVIWRSLDTTVARVSSAGLVTVLTSGATAITATTRGATGFATIEGIGVVSTVEISGANQLPVSQTTRLAAAAREANGRELFSPIVWTSSAPAVATVSATGLVTTLSVGTTTISAATAGKTANLTFTVLPPPPVQTITFTPNSGFLPTTVGVPLTVTLRDANNGVLSGRVITYTSSNPAIATVSATGVVTAQATGAVTITVSSEGKSASANFTALPGLRSGTGVTFSNATNESSFWAVWVPAGSTALAVTLRNGTGDPDLYVYPPGANNPACAAEAAGPTENCNFTNPAAGVWVVESFAFAANAGTTVTATVTPTPPSSVARQP